VELQAFQRETVDLLPRLRRLARAIAGEPADADDLVQLTVERGLSRQAQWAPGARLDCWMFRIMKDAWIDGVRARNRRGEAQEPEEEGLSSIEYSGAPAPALRLQAAEVRRELARLPDQQRLVIALVLVDGLSYREAADVLEIPLGALTSRLGRGRTALMARLAQEEDAA
jgi:RNA polymerase sigma-70 factor (ECF subfamily)